MKKKEPESKSLVITTPTGPLKLFEPPKFANEHEFLPDDISQIVPVQIKFDEVGQHVTGLYCGCTKQDSSLKKDDVFYFHKVKLANNAIIGFIGSSQLDSALCDLPPHKKDIHIIFIEKKDMGHDKVFKSFQVFVRNHVFPKETEQIESPENVPF